MIVGNHHHKRAIELLTQWKNAGFDYISSQATEQNKRHCEPLRQEHIPVEARVDGEWSTPIGEHIHYFSIPDISDIEQSHACLELEASLAEDREWNRSDRYNQ